MRPNEQIPFTLPSDEQRLLLHCCCAPCSGGIILRLLERGILPTLFFYNPNIYPQEEYALRKNELKKFACARALVFVDADYDPELWEEKTNGLAHEPEKGRRCRACFELRLERSARYASEQGFKVFATTLGVSRWKNLDQINSCGAKAAEPLKDLLFWDINWRKNGGSQLMSVIAKQEKFYRQTYCGCRFSLSGPMKNIH